MTLSVETKKASCRSPSLQGSSAEEAAAARPLRDEAAAEEVAKEAREKEATVRQEGSYSRQLHSLMTQASRR